MFLSHNNNLTPVLQSKLWISKSQLWVFSVELHSQWILVQWKVNGIGWLQMSIGKVTFNTGECERWVLEATTNENAVCSVPPSNVWPGSKYSWGYLGNGIMGCVHVTGRLQSNVQRLNQFQFGCSFRKVVHFLLGYNTTWNSIADLRLISQLSGKQHQ